MKGTDEIRRTDTKTISAAIAGQHGSSGLPRLIREKRLTTLNGENQNRSQNQ